MEPQSSFVEWRCAVCNRVEKTETFGVPMGTLWPKGWRQMRDRFGRVECVSCASKANS
jgi:ribosomal protein S27E